jgi:hypothetical protein
MKDMKCEYDEIISHHEHIKNIKKKSHESYAEHINKLMDKYNDEKDHDEE